MTATQATPLVFAGYLRVSDERGRSADVERYRTIPMQKKRSEAIAASEGGTIGEWYLDEDEKGDDPDRDEYRRMLSDVAVLKRYDGVIAARLDRFGRKQSETIAGVEQLREASRRIIFGEPRLDTSDPITGPILLGVFAALAHIELERIRTNWRNVVDDRIAELAVLAVPYGYRRRGANGDGHHTATLVPDDESPAPGQPAPADVVRDIFRQRAERVGWTAIVDELNARGVMTPTQLTKLRNPEQKRRPAQQWGHGAVYSIAQNVAYVGTLRFTRRHRETREVIDHVEHPDAWERLVAPATWEAAQSPEHVLRNGSTGGALLEGLVRCASCARTMRPSTSGKTLTYSCSGKRAGCTHAATITRALIDPWVVSEVRALLAESPAALEAAHVSDELKRLSDELVDLHAERRGLYRALSAKIAAGEQDALVVVDELDERVSALEGQVRTLEAQQRMRTRRLLDVDVWDSAPLDEKRRELSDVVDAVFVKPSGRGRPVAVSDRAAIAWAGQAPRHLLSASGRTVANRTISLDAVRAGQRVVD